MPDSIITSDGIALTSLGVALAALWLSYLAIIRGNKNGSAASLIALNEGFRQGWERFLAAEGDDARRHQFADLMNLLEIACALEFDKALVGKPREILTEYLSEVFGILNGNGEAKELVEGLIGAPTNMKYVQRYIRERKRVG